MGVLELCDQSPGEDVPHLKAVGRLVFNGCTAVDFCHIFSHTFFHTCTRKRFPRGSPAGGGAWAEGGGAPQAAARKTPECEKESAEAPEAEEASF